MTWFIIGIGDSQKVQEKQNNQTVMSLKWKLRKWSTFTLLLRHKPLSPHIPYSLGGNFHCQHQTTCIERKGIRDRYVPAFAPHWWNKSKGNYQYVKSLMLLTLLAPDSNFHHQHSTISCHCWCWFPHHRSRGFGFAHKWCFTFLINPDPMFFNMEPWK